MNRLNLTDIIIIIQLHSMLTLYQLFTKATLHFAINAQYVHLDDVIGRSFTEHLVNFIPILGYFWLAITII